VWKYFQPIKEERSDACKCSKQAACQGYPQGKALNAGADEVDSSSGILMQQDSAVKALPVERLERFPGFILFCKVTNKNAKAQVFVLCSIESQSGSAMVTLT
jgi:hypothetical protein